MTENTTHQNLTALTITEFPKFCELLVERFHTAVEHYCEVSYFTILVSLIDRSADALMGEEKMMFVGLDTQEKLLNVAYKERYVEEIDIAKKARPFWQMLQENPESNDPSIIKTFEKYQNKADNGSFYLAEKIKGGQMYKFLEREPTTFFREIMLKILPCYFDPMESCYFLTLPLIQFGQIDGFIHIIYDGVRHHGKDRLVLEKGVKMLIKAMSNQYETLLLSWAVKGLNTTRATKNIQNPLLLELGFDAYYKKSESYHSKRRELTKEHRKNAVTAIILDSYAHNIGAHSLPTITWWLLKRAEHMQKKLEAPAEGSPFAEFPLIADAVPFPLEMHHLLRFLNEKGEFWAGMSREKTFGGKISNLYSVLWDDFIQNLLVLGTIASTEGVYQLNINLTIYDKIEKKEKIHGFERTKSVKLGEQEDGTPILLNGKFVSINLKRPREKEDLTREVTNADFEKTEFVSNFLIKNEALFEAFKKELITCKAFFPGNTIGKHALFTLIESEIRNIKHYDKAQIEDMKTNGLTLNISIEDSICGRKTEAGKVSTYKDKALYKIGIWLNHPQTINAKSLETRLNLLGEDIIDADFYPKFGGSYQDKICAAFLFNNSFISVQDVDVSDRHNMYYPWVKMGVSVHESDDKSSDKKAFRDYEVSHRRLMSFAESRQFFTTDFDRFIDAKDGDGIGYYKKYIHIWKGEEKIEITSDMKKRISEGWENPARFRFALVPNKKDVKSMRQQGIIRVIAKEEPVDKNAYVSWLAVWLKKPDKPCRINFREVFLDKSKPHKPVEHYELQGSLSFEDNQIRYFNKFDGIEDISSEETDVHTINLVHNNNMDVVHKEICRYRQHGVLMYHFIKGSSSSMSKAVIEQDLAAELFEVLATKICIFDNRIYNRIEATSSELFEMLDEQLMLNICREDKTKWEQVRDAEDGFFNFHFLVVHLSFIEKFKEEKMSVVAFIESEILRDRKPPKNFIFAITTGRGRTNWWRDLEVAQYTDYQNFTTFKPIEDLLDGVENATSKRDDFEIKYRLVKALMGS